MAVLDRMKYDAASADAMGREVNREKILAPKQLQDLIASHNGILERHGTAALRENLKQIRAANHTLHEGATHASLENYTKLAIGIKQRCRRVSDPTETNSSPSNESTNLNESALVLRVKVKLVAEKQLRS